jgi:hypothetical protein
VDGFGFPPHFGFLFAVVPVLFNMHEILAILITVADALITAQPPLFGRSHNIQGVPGGKVNILDVIVSSL